MCEAERTEPDISYLMPTDQVLPLGSATKWATFIRGLLSEGQFNPALNSPMGCPLGFFFLIHPLVGGGVPPQLTPKSS